MPFRDRIDLSETQLTWEDGQTAAKKSGLRCPKCRSTKTETIESEKKFKVYACPVCGYVWREWIVWKPNKVRCFLLMGVACLAYLVGLELLVYLNSSLMEPVSIVIALSVISMPHQALHALARRLLGYRAFPVPILLPPILGFTVGERPWNERDAVLVALAPLSLTAVNWLVYASTLSAGHLFLGGFNLFCMVYDVVPAVRAWNRRGAMLP